MSEKNKVFIMIGCPGSGKSTIAELLAGERDKIVSRDEIRFEMVSEDEPYFAREEQVFNVFIDDINKNIAMCEDVGIYVDATHLNKYSRNKVISRLKGNFELAAVYVKTPLMECLRRNELRKGTRSYVPKATVKAMFNKLKEPKLEEGFDKIYIYDSMSGKLVSKAKEEV